jgi:hypothetical protein
MAVALLRLVGTVFCERTCSSIKCELLRSLWSTRDAWLRRGGVVSQFELKIVSLLEIRKSLSISSFPENLTFTPTEDLFQAFTSTCSGSEGVARRLGERASLQLIHDPRAHLYQPMPAPKQFRQIANFRTRYLPSPWLSSNQSVLRPVRIDRNRQITTHLSRAFDASIPCCAIL